MRLLHDYTWLECLALLALAGAACVLAAIVTLALVVWLVAPSDKRRRARRIKPAAAP